ncbi:MAG: hypothetical protein GMKNLPBB_01367 [Myxococcota bacterium]|nr:hypothetical protein [Myxococcota bacterium]
MTTPTDGEHPEQPETPAGSGGPPASPPDFDFKAYFQPGGVSPGPAAGEDSAPKGVSNSAWMLIFVFVSVIAERPLVNMAQFQWIGLWSPEDLDLGDFYAGFILNIPKLLTQIPLAPVAARLMTVSPWRYSAFTLGFSLLIDLLATMFSLNLEMFLFTAPYSLGALIVLGACMAWNHWCFRGRFSPRRTPPGGQA